MPLHVALNRLPEYVGRNLLCVTHSDRPMDGSSDINYLEARYASPLRLPPLQPFEALRPSCEHSPYLGTISLYDVGEDGGGAPQLVCAFRPTYRAQHCLWYGDRLWVLGAEHIEIYDAGLTSVREIRDPWLAGNHTIAGDGRGRLIVSCSASDSVLTIDADTGAVVGAQRMPEEAYGFNYPLTRDDSVSEHYIINDYQLAHLNCAWPWRGGILTSSKIHGAIGWFDPDAGHRELLRGFVGCHGVRVRSDVEEIFFADSCSGMLVFLDAQGSIIRRVGTGSRWLHDAVQIRGDLFALAPFDQNEVILLNIATREIAGRIACDDRGRPDRLSFGVPAIEWDQSGDGHRTGGAQPVDVLAGALRRQHAAMVRARDELVAAHAREIAVRDATIATLREEYAQAVTTRDRIVAELDASRALAVADLQAHVDRRDRLLAGMNQTLIDLQQGVARAQEEINRRDAMLAEMNGTQIDLQEGVARAQQEINRRDAMLAEMNGTMIELQRAVGRAQEEINRRDRMLAELQEASNEALRARDIVIDALRQECQALKPAATPDRETAPLTSPFSAERLGASSRT